MFPNIPENPWHKLPALKEETRSSQEKGKSSLKREVSQKDKKDTYLLKEKSTSISFEASRTFKKTLSSLRISLYTSRSNAQASSSKITRAPGSAISEAPLKAPSFSIFNKKSAVREDGARPRPIKRELVLPRVQSMAPA
ncbi:hypothetical protein F2Q69_00023598 [Brassica cretica]|uniref:Uncharacterized protein n=1 Tax=Brassica cretica TaxID=69181 RepID=A0A8S9Q721_BRACR|nr:hypothetical protein F2Q69_00023598 [Brassica cretica]